MGLKFVLGSFAIILCDDIGAKTRKVAYVKS